MQRGPLLLVFPLDWNWTDIAVTPASSIPLTSVLSVLERWT